MIMMILIRFRVDRVEHNNSFIVLSVAKVAPIQRNILVSIICQERSFIQIIFF